MRDCPYVIALKIYSCNSTIYQNSSKTLSSYVAQSIGAQKYKNVRRGFKVGLLQGLVFEIPILILTVVFAQKACLIFLPSGSSGAAFDMAVVFARYFMPFVLFNLINNLFHAFYRGVAAMRYLVTATLIGSFSRIIASFIAVRYFKMNGVYIGWVISWVTECIFSLIVYVTGAWKPSEFMVFEAKTHYIPEGFQDSVLCDTNKRRRI